MGLDLVLGYFVFGSIPVFREWRKKDQETRRTFIRLECKMCKAHLVPNAKTKQFECPNDKRASVRGEMTCDDTTT